jgi:hypothetical protein
MDTGEHEIRFNMYRGYLSGIFIIFSNGNLIEEQYFNYDDRIKWIDEGGILDIYDFSILKVDLSHLPLV